MASEIRVAGCWSRIKVRDHRGRLDLSEENVVVASGAKGVHGDWLWWHKGRRQRRCGVKRMEENPKNEVEET